MYNQIYEFNKIWIFRENIIYLTESYHLNDYEGIS